MPGGHIKFRRECIPLDTEVPYPTGAGVITAAAVNRTSWTFRVILLGSRFGLG